MKKCILSFLLFCLFALVFYIHISLFPAAQWGDIERVIPLEEISIIKSNGSYFPLDHAQLDEFFIKLDDQSTFLAFLQKIQDKEISSKRKIDERMKKDYTFEYVPIFYRKEYGDDSYTYDIQDMYYSEDKKHKYHYTISICFSDNNNYAYISSMTTIVN